MPYYRKKKSTDNWHWCKNCSNWPTSDYDEEWHGGSKRPKCGEMCDQCLSKEDTHNCKV